MLTIMNRRIIFLFISYILLVSSALAQHTQKHRVLVLTDIEADPDDAQSLVRFLLYNNQWDVEGLVATTSIHQKTRVAPETIHEILRGYKNVQPNLLKHEKGFASYESLAAKVKKGLPVYGMQGVGERKDSEGSEWIITMLEKPDSRPLWVTVWGGPNTLAQALWKIKATKPAAEAARMYAKLRVYTISDQDDSGPWIRKEFPSVFFVVTPGYNYSKATWLGINFNAPGSNTEVISNAWLAQNIQQGHGPLGVLYPDVAYGMEGDTPTFLSLINNGLNDAEHPNYGGWGGRYELYLPQFEDSNQGIFRRENWPKDEPETRPIWTNASDSVVSEVDKKKYSGNRETIWRWRKDFQHDFAARMDWTVKSYAECNHPPIVKLSHPDRFTVKSGQAFHLNAKGTSDPDGDSVSYLWFQYQEAGSYKGNISFRPYSPNLYDLPVTAPKVDKPQTLHFILQVTDKGTPSLTRYKRVIVTVEP
jgi:hypothetical protein